MGGVYENDSVSNMQSFLLLAREITVQITYFTLDVEENEMHIMRGLKDKMIIQFFQGPTG